MAKVDFNKELQEIEELVRQDNLKAIGTQIKINALLVQLQKHREEVRNANKAALKVRSGINSQRMGFGS